MDLENPTSQDLKAAILADAQIFLASLRSGASEDQLNAILDRIKEREIRLIAEKGLRLSPEVWNILHKRMVHRRPNEIIDTDQGWLSR